MTVTPSGGAAPSAARGSLVRLACLAVILLVAPSCSSDASPPTPTASSTTTSTPPPSPTAVVPTLPPAAVQTPAGAEAFVRYFWDVYTFSYASPESTTFRGIVLDSCRFCQSTIVDIDDAVQAGDRVQGARTKVLAVTATPTDDTANQVLMAVLEQEAGQIIGKNGDVKKEVPGKSPTRSDVRVYWETDSWKMAAVNFPTPQVS